jgi:hypothetical protein
MRTAKDTVKIFFSRDRNFHYAVSRDVRRLAVCETTRKRLVRAIPEAIRDVFRASGSEVSVKMVDDETYKVECA